MMKRTVSAVGLVCVLVVGCMGMPMAGEEVKGAPCGKCFQLNSTHIPPLKQDDFDTMAFLTISQA